MTRTSPLRVANMSGYYGDRLEAAREIVERGEIDVLTGDYLAELTMLILWKMRQKDPSTGYATTFQAHVADLLGTCLDRGIKIVTNAGGLNPRGLAEAVRAQAAALGLAPKIAYVHGDDVVDALPGLIAQGHDLCHLDTGMAFADLGKPAVTANAYLGGWGIAAALAEGADIVICPRVTDAALVVGPAAWAFGWSRSDWDRLAGAVVAGHIIECGAQTTGGNFSFFQDVPDDALPGFPIAEIHPDGSSVITKAPGTGGIVTVDTVSAQILYEIQGVRYANPDVVTRFDSIDVTQDGPDRVRVSGIRGEPAPADAKIAINYVGGYRNEMTMVLTGLDIDKKAALAEKSVRLLWKETPFGTLEFHLWRSDRADPSTNEEACALLRVTVKDGDKRRAGRTFSDAFVQAALSSYPGFFLTTPPSQASEYGIYWPALIPAHLVPHSVTLWDGRTMEIAPTPAGSPAATSHTEQVLAPEPEAGTVEVALGRLFGTRSGDKGGNANIGVWAPDEKSYEWLSAFLTIERLKAILPDVEPFSIARHTLANLRAMNFVIVGLLGEGVASSTRMDRQAKGLGEYLGCKTIRVPGWLAAQRRSQ
ncbi:MAG: acyclic terpene utilization AtuA family protein [Sphingomonadales bacterium]